MKTLYYKLLFLPITVLLSFASVYAQTAADIEDLLSAETISCEQAAWFVLGAVLETPPASSSAAFSIAQEQGWLPANVENSSSVTMSRLSFLLMKSFDLTGGFMYRITGNQRYAFREIKARGLFGRYAYPNFTVSGEQFLQILEDVSAEKEGEWE